MLCCSIIFINHLSRTILNPLQPDPLSTTSSYVQTDDVRRAASARASVRQRRHRSDKTFLSTEACGQRPPPCIGAAQVGAHAQVGAKDVRVCFTFFSTPFFFRKPLNTGFVCFQGFQWLSVRFWNTSKQLSLSLSPYIYYLSLSLYISIYIHISTHL